MNKPPKTQDARLEVGDRIAVLTLDRDDVRNALTGTTLIDDTNLGTKQIGLYDVEYIKEQIVKPRAKQSPGFEDAKSKKAMPTYYGEDLNEAELLSLIAYLKTMRDPTHYVISTTTNYLSTTL